MKNNFLLKRFIPFIFFALLLLLVFKSFFTSNLLAGGDFQFNFRSMFGNYSLYPYAWDGSMQNGMGGYTAPFLWTYFYFSLPIAFFGQLLHLSWNAVERLGYFYPFLVLSFFSSFVMFKKLFPENKFTLFAPFIFIFNTYALLLISGQAKVGLSYAMVPFILYGFIYFQKKCTAFSALVFGALLGIELFLDIRFAYIAIVACFLFFLLTFLRTTQKRKFFFLLFLAVFCSVLLNAFWIVPTLIVHTNPLSELSSAYTTSAATQFLSFARFENSISLLHPNWPENIFGKVYFMRPEFLLIPILAFASLFFVSKKAKKESHYVLYFALLGLIGAFLAKGSNDPFGGLYLWMFNYIPGFIMFRDPSKWYTLIAISYSVLIPFTIWNIYLFFHSNPKVQIKNFKFQNFFLLVSICYLLFLIRPALSGQLGFAFKTTTIPPEYISLENFLSHQQQFSRTLWVPTTQRFGFFSANHPEISTQDFFNIYDEKSFVEDLIQPGTEKLFQEVGVKYLIVPYDSQKEIFLSTGSYNNQEYLQTIADLQKISWLKEVKGFGRIAVFEVPNPKDHIWSTDQALKINYTSLSPVSYRVLVTNARKGDRLVFSESYDPHWVASLDSTNNAQEASVAYDKIFNSFILPKDGNYTLQILYTPQKWVNVGVWISVISLFLICGSLIVMRLKIKL